MTCECRNLGAGGMGQNGECLPESTERTFLKTERNQTKKGVIV
jgi:hypothetical protein